MNDASSSTAGKRREWKKLVWTGAPEACGRCEPSKATFSVPRRKPTDDLGRSPDFEGAAGCREPLRLPRRCRVAREAAPLSYSGGTAPDSHRLPC